RQFPDPSIAPLPRADRLRGPVPPGEPRGDVLLFRLERKPERDGLRFVRRHADAPPQRGRARGILHLAPRVLALTARRCGQIPLPPLPDRYRGPELSANGDDGARGPGNRTRPLAARVGPVGYLHRRAGDGPPAEGVRRGDQLFRRRADRREWPRGTTTRSDVQGSPRARDHLE